MSEEIILENKENTAVDNSVNEDLTKYIKKEKTSLKKILIGLIVLLSLLIIVGLMIFIFSSNEPQVENIQEVATQEEATQEILEEEKEPEVIFDLSSINSKKLNDQLASFTNKNIQKENSEDFEKLEEERRILEEQKRIEEESLRIEADMLIQQKDILLEKKAELQDEMEKLEALKQEAILAKEELLKAQNINNNSSKEQFEEKEIKDENLNKEASTPNIPELNEKVTKENNNEFLKFINVAKIKGVLYKKYLDKASKINPNILLCRDDLNRIELIYGPFNSDEDRQTLIGKLVKNGFSEAYEVEFTKEEFDKKCNY